MTRLARAAIIVVGARVPVPESEVTSAVTVLDEDEIALRGPILSDALRAIPGLAVSRSGPAGPQSWRSATTYATVRPRLSAWRP